jgi:hypothetical protein
MLIFVAVLAMAPDAGARTPRPLSTDPSTCDGIANYAGELSPFNYRLVRQTAVGDGLTEVEIALDLRKRIRSPFRAASVSPDLASLRDGGAHGDLGVRLTSILPAEFPAIGATQKSVSSSEPLVLRLPARNVPDLRRRLRVRRIPMTVHADEERLLQPGVRIEAWWDAAMIAFARGLDLHAAGNWEAVEAQAPYAPDAEYVIELAQHVGAEGLDSFFTAITPGERLYLVPGDAVFGDLPESLHYLQVIDAVFDESYLLGPGRFGTAWLVRVRRTDLESIPEIYASGSFCTPPSNHIDWPVQASRHEIDPDLGDDADRDTSSQPIRFNQIALADGAVTLSGQVQRHVLKPALDIRVRPHGVRVAAAIDTDLSMSAELRSEESQSVSDRFSLYDLCLPLGSLPVGPVPVALNLQLQHDLQVDGTIGAGAVVGIQKRFQAGFTLGHDSRLLPGDPWFGEPRHTAPHSVEFKAPQLTDGTAAHLTVDSNARAIVRVGAEYPFCDTGFGASTTGRRRSSSGSCSQHRRSSDPFMPVVLYVCL